MNRNKIEDELNGIKKCVSCKKVLIDMKNWEKQDYYRICNKCITEYIDSSIHLGIYNQSSKSKCNSLREKEVTQVKAGK